MRGAAVVAVLAGAATVTAAPVVTGSQVRAFLGGLSGKLVYTKLDCNDNSCNKQGRSLWYVDFSDETLVERQIVDYHSLNTEPRNAIVSPDGRWVVYNTRQTNNPLYVCRLQENATAILLGYGALPVWWVRPGTSELYVIYVDHDLEDGGWVGSYNGGFPTTQAGATRCLRVNPSTMERIGDPQLLLQYQANGGRSANGAWMFTAGGCPGTFHIDSLAVANATVFSTVSLSVNPLREDDTLDGCNPSMSPHWETSDIRVMYILRNASMDHRGYWICGVQGEPRLKVLWNDAENPYIDETQWSNHPDFAAAKASLRILTAPFDLYIYRVWDGAHIKVLEGNYSFPYLWVDHSAMETRTRRPHRAAPEAQPQGPVVDIRGRRILACPPSGLCALAKNTRCVHLAYGEHSR